MLRPSSIFVLRFQVFLRAYAQQAVCGPSRNSFMSGRRPGTCFGVGGVWSGVGRLFSSLAPTPLFGGCVLTLGECQPRASVSFLSYRTPRNRPLTVLELHQPLQRGPPRVDFVAGALPAAWAPAPRRERYAEHRRWQAVPPAAPACVRGPRAEWKWYLVSQAITLRPLSLTPTPAGTMEI